MKVCHASVFWLVSAVADPISCLAIGSRIVENALGNLRNSNLYVV